MKWKVGIALNILAVLLLSENTHGLAVMSIDLGSEWMKIGIVSVNSNPSFLF
jgi:hypothetical protein